ncbi:L-histidine N(alpha)-methyltransferase [Zooshikella sp. RANM57]|uniref:L-histidine N(alpha)-methyltransferase n=1 Tax=Zooshikella sp. RANM57 TaxID=3425863 RepID=UPI003D6E5086
MTATKEKIQFHDLQPKLENMRDEVFAGFSAHPKQLPATYFYDQRGSALFDKITQLPEYYLTRCEISILQQYANDIAQHIAPESILVEYGSGSSQKIKILLEAVQPAIYMPLDISKEHLLNSVNSLANHFPDLAIHATCVDYSKPWKLPTLNDLHKPSIVGFFPGSSIGNFEPRRAIELLKRIHDAQGKGSHLLIGIDLLKDVEVLHAAYNDKQQITAQFNLNILHHINRELDGNITVDYFSHCAFFNPKHARMEMHLTSNLDQIAHISGKAFHFRKNENIHTENSYKYSLNSFEQLVRIAGFKIDSIWSDDQKQFAIVNLFAV